MTINIIEASPQLPDNSPFDAYTVASNVYTETHKYLPDMDGCAGKYLKVSQDESHALWGAGGGGGTSDYNELDNKPCLQSVELIGDTTLAEIGAIENVNPTKPVKMGINESGQLIYTYEVQ